MKKFGLLIFHAALLAFMFAAVESVNAATVFNLASGDYSGEITIDTVTGTVVSGDINVTGFPPDFTTPFTAGYAIQFGSKAELFFANSSTFPTSLFTFVVINGGSFVGFSGATISSV